MAEKRAVEKVASKAVKMVDVWAESMVATKVSKRVESTAAGKAVEMAAD